MAKNKSSDSESKGRGLKRKTSSSNEMVSVKEITESKVKKKRKKTEAEKAPLQTPDISIKADDQKHKEDIKHKKKQITEQTKKKKKKQRKMSEPPGPPAVTRELQEEMEGEEDLSPEERRVLERKMKKILKKDEKKRLKAEGNPSGDAEAKVPIAPQQALDYLTCWSENRKEWKFQKIRQTWLLQHMFDSAKVPDESFSMLLLYLEGLRGGARDTTVQKATVLVQDPAPGDRDAQQRVHRAREVIQLLT